MGTASVSSERCGDDNLSIIHPSIRRELACVDRRGCRFIACESIIHRARMTMNKKPTSSYEKVRAEQIEYNAKRAKGYREQALKLYPWLCGRCAREFNRVGLSELTVHHVDHNHDNNPIDGSNWELLCIYCHDEEHTKFENLVRYGNTAEHTAAAATYNPFADLKDKMSGKK